MWRPPEYLLVQLLTRLMSALLARFANSESLLQIECCAIDIGRLLIRRSQRWGLLFQRIARNASVLATAGIGLVKEVAACASVVVA